jgi:hypothetical protein
MNNSILQLRSLKEKVVELKMLKEPMNKQKRDLISLSAQKTFRGSIDYKRIFQLSTQKSTKIF